MKKNILVTGATGLVGRHLCRLLIEQGYNLIVLGRKEESEFRKHFDFPCSYVCWSNPDRQPPSLTNHKVHHVVHLMGEPLAQGRWTKARMSRFRTSRVEASYQLIKALETQQDHLQSFVSASAIGFYGSRNDEVLTENSTPGAGFLPELCRDWEFSCQEAPCRSVQLRIGMVLSRDGGALAEMEPIFSLGIGGKLASGKQWMSWIHIDDLVQLILEAIQNPNMEGAYNAVSPNHVRNLQFTQEFAHALHTWAPFPAPSFALFLLKGRMAELILASQRVEPERLVKQGFQFKFPTLHEALDHLYSWKTKRSDSSLTQIQWLPQPIGTVFPFFSDEKNLESITPAMLSFRVVGSTTPTVQEGTKITYRLKVRGFPLTWISVIRDWNPPTMFRDVQIKGPYAKWDHTHQFQSLADGTLVLDQVVYRLPILARIIPGLGSMIRKDVNKIFDFRRQRLVERFTEPPRTSSFH